MTMRPGAPQKKRVRMREMLKPRYVYTTKIFVSMRHMRLIHPKPEGPKKTRAV